MEFEILAILARNPGRVFSRTMLLDRLWGDSAFRDPRTIDVHIRHLREKIERDPKEPELLFTVRGVGTTSETDEPAASARGPWATAGAAVLRDHGGRVLGVFFAVAPAAAVAASSDQKLGQLRGRARRRRG